MATDVTAAAREWGHRFVDGTAGPDESRDAAARTVARFAFGLAEIVYRDSPDGPWVRDGYQPHVPGERIDALADFVAPLRRSNDWRGHRLVELGEHPNPPHDWQSVALADPDPDRAALEVLLDATAAPHAIVTSHGGQHWHVTHPAACDRLPYGVRCLFDLARELRGYEQEPPDFGTFTGTPYVAHDHGDGPCRHECPVLIRWSSAESELPAPEAGQQEVPAERGFRVGDLVQITGRHDDESGPEALKLLGRTGVVTEIDDNPEFPIGLTVDGWVGLVWCNSTEIRHLSAEEIAWLESGAVR